PHVGGEAAGGVAELEGDEVIAVLGLLVVALAHQQLVLYAVADGELGDLEERHSGSVHDVAVVGDTDFFLVVANPAGLGRDPGGAEFVLDGLGRRLHGEPAVGVFLAVRAGVRLGDAFRTLASDLGHVAIKGRGERCRARRWACPTARWTGSRRTSAVP